MTGLELLQEEMRRRGATPNQINSKAVGMVLDIISGSISKNTYLDIAEAKQHLTNIRNQLSRDEQEMIALRRRIQKEKDEWYIERNKMNEAMKDLGDEYIEYIENFQKSLMETETPEGRDAMRIAQMFINSVEIDTKYDNTAFIIGLSAILSGNRINAMEELKAINPKLFREKTIDPTKGVRIV